MNIKLKVKDGNKKLEALEEVERHIKEARRLLIWVLDGPLEIEGEALPRNTEELSETIEKVIAAMGKMD